MAYVRNGFKNEGFLRTGLLKIDGREKKEERRERKGRVKEKRRPEETKRKKRRQ